MGKSQSSKMAILHPGLWFLVERFGTIFSRSVLCNSVLPLTRSLCQVILIPSSRNAPFLTQT